MEHEHMQRRSLPGPQARAQVRHHDIVRTLRDARLPDMLRTQLLEHVETAIVRDVRQERGGLEYLSDLADDMPALPRLRETTSELATCFNHPSLR